LYVVLQNSQLLKTNFVQADSHLLQDYFTEIYRSHRTNPDFLRALYVCPIIFDRNSHDTNCMVRVADILWGCAGLASNFPGSSIHIPTSVYSLPLTLAEGVGGWDADATAIGEDMHMFLKCYFNTRGTLVTIPIHSPASQCNLSSRFSEQSWRRTFDTIRARYRQARRHMWGSLDTGYAVRRMLRTRSFRLSHIPLFHLLWEAHLSPSHFVLTLLASALYTLSTPRSDIHPHLLWAFSVCAVLRNISFLLMQLVFSLYEDLHALCVYKRASDMRDAGISDSDTMFSYREPMRWTYLAERVLFPVAGVVFGTVPALQAQLCHFWTDKLVYTVTAKPLLGVQAAAKRADMA
jgi:Glycosyl transferase family group 2